MHPLRKSDWILKNEEIVMVRSPGDTPGSGLIVSEGADATGVGSGSGMGRENCLRAKQVGRTGPAQKEPWWPPSSECRLGKPAQPRLLLNHTLWASGSL